MTGGAFLRRAARVPAAALAAGLLAGAPPAVPREAGEAVVLSSSEIAHLFGGARDVVTAADGTVYYGKGLVVLPAIAFELGSDRPTPASQAQIARLATALKVPAFRESRFSVEGHIDSAEGAAGNEGLSLRRARRVATILVEDHGVPPDMLAACGRGTSVPLEGVAPDDSRRRRVEVMRDWGLVGLAQPESRGDAGGAPGACRHRRPPL